MMMMMAVVVVVVVVVELLQHQKQNFSKLNPGVQYKMDSKKSYIVHSGNATRVQHYKYIYLIHHIIGKRRKKYMNVSKNDAKHLINFNVLFEFKTN